MLINFLNFTGVKNLTSNTKNQWSTVNNKGLAGLQQLKSLGPNAMMNQFLNILTNLIIFLQQQGIFDPDKAISMISYFVLL